MTPPKPYHPILVKLTPEEYKAFRKLCVENDTNPTHEAAKLIRQELFRCELIQERMESLRNSPEAKIKQIIGQANQDTAKTEVRFTLLKPPGKSTKPS